jgi:hypothetical protein
MTQCSTVLSHCLMMCLQGVNGPLSSQFKPTAHATLHLCLAPDQEVHTAIKALKQHCIAVRLLPFGRALPCTIDVCLFVIKFEPVGHSLTASPTACKYCTLND